MSRGGTDCCGTCEFNRIGQEPTLDQDRTFTCEIRQMIVDNPFWTHCYNHQRRNPLLQRAPRGPLWATVSGALRPVPWDEGPYILPELLPPRDLGKYTRVPYYVQVRPLDSDRGQCAVCGVETDHTIALRLPRPLDGAPISRLCFCSVAHYLQWWIQNAPEAEPYRERKPVSSEALYTDLLLLADEMSDLEAQLLRTLDEKRLLDTLAGLEGALIQAGHGYVDLSRVETYLQQPETRGELSPDLLRIQLIMAQIGELLQAEPRDRLALRSAVHRIHETLDRFLAGKAEEGKRLTPAKKWWQFWK